jgi:glutaredoxin-related protein
LQVYVKGEFVGGADVLDEMVQSGEIKQLLN